ncbi:MAG: MBL fold metallo-hydrolase [Verrucomicrobiales bacterium]|jgi:phosphoribosyl 1,2-cyclic phosphodiesterase|nr:MBL fold metallo-hydrolase [Verrucomicrobiales bacterium]
MDFLRLTILASGSAGNCALLETARQAILVDAGMSGKKIVECLALTGRKIEDVSAVLLTHEHSDHITGLPVLANRHKIPIYANTLTANAVQPFMPKYKDWRIFETGAEIDLGDLRVENFPIPHDAYDPVGFVAHAGGFSVGFLTDLGYATRLVLDRVKGVNALLLEANYDLNMLRNDTKRPWPTKQRIMARHGHLSNDAAAEVAAQVMHDKLENIFLGHKSSDCNTHELAELAVSAKLKELGATHVQLQRTYQNQISVTVELK